MNFDPADVGTVDQQQELLNQQLARAQAMRQMAMQRPAYGAAAGIGAGLSSLFGGIHQAQLESQQKDLIQKQQGALTGAAQAYSDASTPEAQRALAMHLLLSGNKQLTGAGQSLLGQQNMAPRLALEGQQLKSEQQKYEQAGPQAALGGQTPSAYELLTKRKMATQVGINPVTGLPYQKTGVAPSADSRPPTGNLNDKRLPKMQADFAKDFDPNISRGGLLKDNQSRLNAANRLLALAQDPMTGGPADLTPQQMSEVSNSLATLIGGGSSGEGTRHELTPYTKGRSLATITQWLTDEPHGAGQQAFVAQMIATAKREQGVAADAIKSAEAKRLANHLSYFGLFPDQARSQLTQYGWDPDQIDFKTGKYNQPTTAQAPQAAPQAPAGGKQIVKYQQNKAQGVKRAVYSDGSYGPNEPL